MPLTLDLNDTFGAVLIGAMISAMLFGVTAIQAWRYFQTYRDRSILRVMVASVIIMEALHFVLVVHAIYYYLILNFGNVLALFIASWSIIWLVGITAVLTFVVHLFYVHYVWQISKRNYLLSGCLLLITTAHFVLAIAIAVEAQRLKSFARFATEAHSIVTASLSLSAAADLSIAFSVSYLLHSSRSGWKSTDTLINKLIVYAIHNGMLTSAVDIIVLVFVTIQKKNLIFVAIFTVLGNLYAISMMATLNARRSPSNRVTVEGPTSVNVTFEGTDSTTDTPGQTSHISQFIPMPTRVHVHSTTEKVYG